MAGREDEAIAIEPLGMCRVVDEVMSEQDGADLGASEREAQVAALTGVDGVDGETTRGRGGGGEDVLGYGHGRAVYPRDTAAGGPKWTAPREVDARAFGAPSGAVGDPPESRSETAKRRGAYSPRSSAPQ